MSTTTTQRSVRSTSKACSTSKTRPAPKTRLSPHTKTNHPSVPWIDPPNYYRSDLVVPFKPFDPCVERFPLQRLRKIQKSLPFDTLPLILIPPSKFELKPPVMRYGWVVDRFQSKLFQYAKDHNLRVPCSPKTHIEGYDSDNEYDSDESEMALTAKDLNPEKDGVGYLLLLQEAALLVVEELNLTWPSDLINITCPLNAHNPLILSLFTNYDLARAPSPKSVEALHLWLEEREQPKWYLDQMNYKWRPGDGRRW
ncbi:hypothetical protein BKA93DRAFT_930571 [Sparassis latifolia]